MLLHLWTCRDYISIGDLKLGTFSSFLWCDGLIVQLSQTRECLDDELAVVRVLSNWVIPEPEDLELLAVLQIPHLEDVRDLVLSEIELCQVMAENEVLETGYLVEGQTTDLESW